MAARMAGVPQCPRHPAGRWEHDRPKAIEYLNNDMAITAKVMERLLGISELSVKPETAAEPQLDLGY